MDNFSMNVTAEGMSETKWNIPATSVEEAINIGTIYALKRAGILFGVNRICST